MEPQISVNYLAIGGCVVANFILGWIWYGPLFGKPWAKEMGFPVDFKPAPGQLIKSMIFSIIGAFLISYCLTHSQQVWRPSVWGVGPDGPNFGYGFMSGFFTWLGFFVPLLLNSLAWEGKSWKLFGINAAYHFISLQMLAMILAHWR